MESNEFKLQERTALISGPCTSITQSIASTLTRLGCNVAMTDTKTETHQRFADRLCDEREIHERYGRAAAFPSDFLSPKGLKDVVSRAAEIFGGVDIYIDALEEFDQTAFRDAGAVTNFDHLLAIGLRAPIALTQNILPFLEGRKRGRVIYLVHDNARLGMANQNLTAAVRGGLVSFAQSLSRETAVNKVTVNCVNIGLSEETLLAFGKNQMSIQAAHAEVLKLSPSAQITEPDKVAQVVAFLASSLGAGINGQIMNVSR